MSGEVQLSVSTEAGADERRRSMRDQRGDVDRWVVRRVQKGQGEREEELEEQEQVSQEGALTGRHRGDGKYCNDTANNHTREKVLSNCGKHFQTNSLTNTQTNPP